MGSAPKSLSPNGSARPWLDGRSASANAVPSPGATRNFLTRSDTPGGGLESLPMPTSRWRAESQSSRRSSGKARAAASSAMSSRVYALGRRRTTQHHQHSRPAQSDDRITTLVAGNKCGFLGGGKRGSTGAGAGATARSNLRSSSRLRRIRQDYARAPASRHTRHCCLQACCFDSARR